MTFGEAIRVGAQMRPTTTGAVFGYLLDGRLAACALGHAYEGLTGEANALSQARVCDTLERAFPSAMQRVHCPVPQCRFTTANGSMLADKDGRIRLVDAVWHLNDTHEWTAQDVAAWVDEVTA